MAGRPVWRGMLRLALVSCPVALHTVRRSSGELHFKLINPETGNTTRTQVLDAGTDAELDRKDLVRGFEVEKDEFVLLGDEDFDAARVESSAILDVRKFVPTDSIDPIYFDASYYLAPDASGGKGAALGIDVYTVLRDAIAQSGRAALSRVVLSRRERAVAILPLGTGLVVHTLHDAREVADPESLFGDLPEAASNSGMVELALQLIERQSAAFDPKDMEDRYETRLREVIAAKARGRKSARREASAPAGDNVVDLMAALRRSLGQVEPGARKTAKRTAGKKAAPSAKAPVRRRRASTA